MDNYIIVIVGCDGVTAIEKELNPEQLSLLVEMAEQFNKNSDYNCEPRMSIVSTKGEEVYKCWDNDDTRGVDKVDVISKYKIDGFNY